MASKAVDTDTSILSPAPSLRRRRTKHACAAGAQTNAPQVHKRRTGQPKSTRSVFWALMWCRDAVEHEPLANARWVTLRRFWLPGELYPGLALHFEIRLPGSFIRSSSNGITRHHELSNKVFPRRRGVNGPAREISSGAGTNSTGAHLRRNAQYSIASTPKRCTANFCSQD